MSSTCVIRRSPAVVAPLWPITRNASILRLRCLLPTGSVVPVNIPIAVVAAVGIMGVEQVAQLALAAVTGLDSSAHILYALFPSRKNGASSAKPLGEFCDTCASDLGMGIVLNIAVVLRLRAGKGGFKKQLVRKGRAYARAVLERERAERQQRAAEHRERRAQRDRERADGSRGKLGADSAHPGASQHRMHRGGAAHDDAAARAAVAREVQEKRRHIAAERQRIRVSISAAVDKGFAVVLDRFREDNMKGPSDSALPPPAGQGPIPSSTPMPSA